MTSFQSKMQSGGSRRLFLHNPLNLPSLPTQEVEGKRHYVTPNGIFPSVTTVLSNKLDKTALIKWQEAVGEQEASKVLGMAGVRGTAVHELCEQYIDNNPYFKAGAMPVNIETFTKFKRLLDEHLGTVYALEGCLYSKLLQTAGRTDVLAGWRGLNTVLDFKSSRRIKTEDDIEGYFLQATCYSLMAEELTSMKFPQICILIACDHYADPLEFVRPRDIYIPRVYEVFGINERLLCAERPAVGGPATS